MSQEDVEIVEAAIDAAYAAASDPDALCQLEGEVREQPDLDEQQRRELLDRLDIARVEHDQEAPKSSLQQEMEAHPERFPGGTYVKARPGHFELIFIDRKPSGTGDDSPPKAPSDDT